MFTYQNLIFIPYTMRHWEMYRPLVKSFENSGIKVFFVVIDAYHYIEQTPSIQELENYNVIKLSLRKPIPKQYSKLTFFYSLYKEILPKWRGFLKKHKYGILVSVDFGAIHRIMINAAKKYGYKIATMQDGYYISLPTKYGWSIEKGRKKRIKQILMHTPFERFFNSAIGAAADHWGLYGQVTRDRFCREAGFPEERTIVIGSPRHKVFREKVELRKSGRVSLGTFNILCLPTGFSLYQDPKLYQSQDEALQWLLQTCIKLEQNIGYKITVNLKIKNGYDHQRNHYEKILRNPMVHIHGSNSNLVDLVASADLVITTGSTASLEVAICNLPVIQIGPEYLRQQITMISSLPLAKSQEELESLLFKVHSDGKKFYQEHCLHAHNEMADIDPNWDSIKKTTQWLIEILKD